MQDYNLQHPFLFLLIFLTIGCGDDTEVIIPEDNYTIPFTYDFENVNYAGQTQRMAMLLELKSYMSTANTIGNALDVAVLKGMYTNDPSSFSWAGNYESSKQLKNKTFESEQEKFEALMSEMAVSSHSSVAGFEGQAGVVTSADGEKSYLLSADGLEYTQVIEKGLMGACFYYQATAVYMGEDKMNVDNEVIEPGEGTAMEHHWDEAFGYYGVPIDFPSNTDGIAFWGKYCNDRDLLLGSNQKMMDAFLKGRAAISNDDMDARDEAIESLRKEWELVSVSTAIHYINSSINHFDDVALRAHAISEAIAFTYALIFNPERSISVAQINDLLTIMAGSDDFLTMNTYNASIENLQQAKNDLAGFYNLEELKDQL